MYFVQGPEVVILMSQSVGVLFAVFWEGGRKRQMRMSAEKELNQEPLQQTMDEVEDPTICK